MVIVNLLNDIIYRLKYDVNLASSFEIISLLQGINNLLSTIQDENLREWVGEYSSHWTKNDNILKNVESFKIETYELNEALTNYNSLDFEI